MRSAIEIPSLSSQPFFPGLEDWRSQTSQSSPLSQTRSRLRSGFQVQSIFIGGGEEIYRLFLQSAQRIYLTQIHAAFGGDRHFPTIDGDVFALPHSELIEGEIPYTYETYERR